MAILHGKQGLLWDYGLLWVVIKLKKKGGPKHTHLAMFWNFCVG